MTTIAPLNDAATNSAPRTRSAACVTCYEKHGDPYFNPHRHARPVKFDQNNLAALLSIPAKVGPRGARCRCARCGREFPSVRAFDDHRTGPWNARSCLSEPRSTVNAARARA